MNVWPGQPGPAIGRLSPRDLLRCACPDIARRLVVARLRLRAEARDPLHVDADELAVALHHLARDQHGVDVLRAVMLVTTAPTALFIGITLSRSVRSRMMSASLPGVSEPIFFRDRWPARLRWWRIPAPRAP